MGPQLILGRSTACHVSLVDPKVPLQAARLQVADRDDGMPEVTLQCLSAIDGFTVNDAQLQANQTVTLHKGDTIRIPGSGNPFRFVFRPGYTLRAPSPTAKNSGKMYAVHVFEICLCI